MTSGRSRCPTTALALPPEFVDKVFVIFQRLHGRDAYGGTGIGLALCKKIVEHHGGTIWIDTAYTGGTQFRFTLPVLAPAPDSAPPDAASPRHFWKEAPNDPSRSTDRRPAGGGRSR